MMEANFEEQRRDREASISEQKALTEMVLDLSGALLEIENWVKAKTYDDDANDDVFHVDRDGDVTMKDAQES